jgi:hypothetical protein
MRLSLLESGRRFADAIAHGCLRAVPQAAAERAALHVADALICLRQFQLQVLVPQCLEGQTIEILESRFHYHFPSLQGPRQIADRIVNVEQHGVGHVAYIVEAPLRTPRLQGGHRHAGPVPADKLRARYATVSLRAFTGSPSR